MRQRDLPVARLHQRLHRVEGGALDQRRYRDRHDLGVGLLLLGVGAAVELVFADIGAARQNAVDLADTPSAAVAGEDAAGVQVLDDRLDAHLAVIGLRAEREPVVIAASGGFVLIALAIGLSGWRRRMDHARPSRWMSMRMPESRARLTMLAASSTFSGRCSPACIAGRPSRPNNRSNAKAIVRPLILV